MGVRSAYVLFASAAAIWCSACATTLGSATTHDSFVHPNSQVRVVGPVSGQMTKVRFLGIGSQFKAADVLKVHREALAKQPGANVILNVAQDTQTRVIFPMVISHYIVSGDGAEVKVFDPAGNQ